MSFASVATAIGRRDVTVKSWVDILHRLLNERGIAYSEKEGKRVR